MLDNKFNIRQMQAYAALCLWQFCACLGIRHSSINELVLHLLKMLSAQNLLDWERRGSTLDITGRGDPLPEYVSEIVPITNLDSFNALVESCVEVGIVDMYGASTDQPSKFLKNCIEILRRANVEPPYPELLSKYGRGSGPWGDAIEENELRDILAAYRVNIP
ncbi:hypothetical protein [Methylobacter sp. BBA5.1]|uniref:hypothetical protein n=1 Tax=Methylobacter sp. BBA5.1 TaxID=1495064 RepID=UPI001268ABDA|nr:hypothetical protein [Methylobacter sp. BBA5.1]